MISNPRYDFIGYEGETTDTKTEIEKVAEYVNEFKNLIVTVDSSTPPLPNLQEYLHEYWGIGYKPYHKINDMEKSVRTGGNDGYSVVGQYEGTGDSSAAYNIHKIASSEGARTVFRNAVELFSDEGKAKTGVRIEPVLKTYSSARSIYTEEDAESSVTGEFPLMLLSTYHDYGENNAIRYQYVMLVSSSGFASDTFLGSGFGNSKVVLGATRVMSTERVSPDIKYKPFVKEGLTIEIGTANTLTWFVSGVFPLIIIVLGLGVFLKRRHL